jgi:hypothetical protein
MMAIIVPCIIAMFISVIERNNGILGQEGTSIPRNESRVERDPDLAEINSWTIAQTEAPLF